MSTTIQIDEAVYEENQAPQWTREEAFKVIYAAHQSFSACEPMKSRTNTAE